jgi:hypothetical protein
MNDTRDEAAEAAILELVRARGPGKSICPTEAARVLGGDAWRGELGRVRMVAMGLARDGRIDILRKGKAVEPDGVRGVIRLRVRG